MTQIHLDTSFILSGLSSFQGETSNACTQKQVRDTLELCNNIVYADCITYDGEVRKWTDERLAPAICKAISSDNQAQKKLLALFSPIGLEEEKAKEVLKLAISNTTDYLKDILRGIKTLEKDIKGNGPTKPEKYLYPYVIENQNPSDDFLKDLLQDKEITGRRFYWAILSNEAILRRFRDVQKQINEKSLSLLFSIFRIYFAYHRADKNDLYITSPERRELVMKIFVMIPELQTTLNKILKSKNIPDQLIYENENARFRQILYPGVISIVMKERHPKSREAFIMACLAIREEEIISKIKDLEKQLVPGKNLEDVIKSATELYEKYSNHESPKMEARIKSFFKSFVSIAVAYYSEDLSLLDLKPVFSKPIDYFKKWESSDSKAAMFLGRELMPRILPDDRIKKEIQEIFGSIPKE